MQSSGHTSVAAQGTGTERKATGRAQTRVEGETDRQRELTPTSRITREDFIPLKQEAPVPSRTRRAADADAWGLRDAAGPRRGQLGEAIATARARGRRRARCCASPRRPGRVSDRHMRTRGDRWALPVPVQGLCTCTCTGRRDVARARHVMPCRAAPRRRAVFPVACARERETGDADTAAAAAAHRVRAPQRAPVVSATATRPTRRAARGGERSDASGYSRCSGPRPRQPRSIRDSEPQTQQQHACGSRSQVIVLCRAMCVCKRRISPPIRKPRYGHPTASARSRQSTNQNRKCQESLLTVPA
jgi:hypothetical protein